MIWKRILKLAAAAILLAVGFHYYQGQRAKAEVDSLIAKAEARGLRTNMRQLLVPQSESGTVLVQSLEGVSAYKDLRGLKFEDSNLVTARNLVASSQDSFEMIAEFANLEVYVPPRELRSGVPVPDYSTLASAMRAEAWRGYLLAIDGEFDVAIESVETLIGFRARLQDEAFPIGRMIGSRGAKDIHRIMLELARRNSNRADRIERLIVLAKNIDVADWKSVVEFELASGLLFIDEIEAGAIDSPKQVGLGPMQLRVSRSARELNEARSQILESAISYHDAWESAPLEVVDPGGMATNGALEVPSMKTALDAARRSERNEIADLRALRLVLEAYRQRATTGTMPSTSELSAAGVETKDPWTDEQFTLHQEADGRIWVGGMRMLPHEMPPRKPKHVDIFAGRP